MLGAEVVHRHAPLFSKNSVFLQQFMHLSRVATARKLNDTVVSRRGQKANDLKRQQAEGRRKKPILIGSFQDTSQIKERPKSQKVTVAKPVVNSMEQEVTNIISSDETIIASSGENPAFENTNTRDTSSFEELGLSEELTESLGGQRIFFPTVIQRLAIPKILCRNNVICAAQTGSGKTVAYLAPIIHALKEEEQQGYIRRPSRPRVCIILPVRELALQTLRVIKSLSRSIPLKSEAVIPGRKRKWIKENIRDTVDIVVGTPKEILMYRDRGRMYFSDVNFLVLDEADTLLDPSFRPVTKSIIEGVMMKGKFSDHYREPQCTLTMATFPKQSVLDAVTVTIPEVEIITAGLHRVLPHVTHKFVKTRQKFKPAMLLKYVETFVKSQRKKTMVFTNSTKTCAWLSHYLNENDIDHIALHGDIRKNARGDAWEAIMDSGKNLIVCTDIASRGLDTSYVSLVINYDCPMTVMDYLHRAGRTGRVGSMYNHTPEVYTMVTGHNESVLAAKIKLAAEKKEALDNIELRSQKERTKK